MNSSPAAAQSSATTQTTVTPPQPPLPAKPKNPLSVGIVILLLAALGYFGYQNWQLQQQVNRFNAIIKVDNAPYNFSSPSPFPSFSSDPTANWKTYQGESSYTKDGSSLFQVKYPADWEIDRNILFPFGKSTDEGIETKIILGAGGHGWEGKIEPKSYPAGEATYSWFDDGTVVSAFAAFDKGNHSYIIELQNLPSGKSQEFKVIFDQILSTFEFLN